MSKLAIDGGIPVRDSKLFYGHQFIEQEDIEAVEDVLKSSYLTCGPYVEKMETALKQYTGAKYAVAVSSGTAALHCACLAAGIGPGDEVITTPLTFAASANCVLYCGAIPVFADIDPETYNIDPESVREKITGQTKALVAVDYTGQAVKLDELMALCHEKEIVLIEDASHSIGTKYKGKSVGSIADMTTFSFHPVKTVTGGEGGAVLTNREDLYEKLLLCRSHGITKEEQCYVNESHGPWYHEQIDLGYNYRLTDIQCALILSQIDKLAQFSKRRSEIVEQYDKAFSQIPQLFVQREIPESETTRHLYILRIRPELLNIDRRGFFEAMMAENICCNVHYIPVYWHPYYEKLGYKKGLCPNAEKLYQEMMSLPIYYSLTDKDVEDVIQAVQKIVDYYKK